jgi:hypothetical protein
MADDDGRRVDQTARELHLLDAWQRLDHPRAQPIGNLVRVRVRAWAWAWAWARFGARGMVRGLWLESACAALPSRASSAAAPSAGVELRLSLACSADTRDWG